MAKENKNLEQLEHSGQRSKGVNTMLWLMAIIFVVVAAVGNVYFVTQLSLVVRVLALVGLLVGAVVFIAFTNQGQKAIGFMKEARQELRKIIWPTRQESTQTTLIVLGVCAIVALALWGIDALIINVITFLTNLRF
ncbi:preprotein translocase subunit SecE [Nicoletella semolina]|nr:preprotein translocase subunit SecE [Nicoletella semolina]MDH2924728.1 preprotein translocase subunit SecE [Nicoletella semolina]